jgi:hypothetical protein
MPAKGTIANKTQRYKIMFLRKLIKVGGCVKGLSKFNHNHLGWDYRTAHDCVSLLESDDYVVVERNGPGRPMIIQIAGARDRELKALLQAKRQKETIKEAVARMVAEHFDNQVDVRIEMTIGGSNGS